MITRETAPSSRAGCLPGFVICFIILLGFIALAGHGGSSSSSSDSKQQAAPDKVITRGVYATYDLVVGHKHRVREAMTDQYDASELVKSREGQLTSFSLSPAQVIEQFYAKDDYLHYGNTGEPSQPWCKIDDQDPVDLDDEKDAVLNTNQPKTPVSCTTDNGEKLYVTGWGSDDGQ